MNRSELALPGQAACLNSLCRFFCGSSYPDLRTMLRGDCLRPNSLLDEEYSRVGSDRVSHWGYACAQNFPLLIMIVGCFYLPLFMRLPSNDFREKIFVSLKVQPEPMYVVMTSRTWRSVLFNFVAPAPPELRLTFWLRSLTFSFP